MSIIILQDFMRAQGRNPVIPRFRFTEACLGMSVSEITEMQRSGAGPWLRDPQVAESSHRATMKPQGNHGEIISVETLQQ